MEHRLQPLIPIPYRRAEKPAAVPCVSDSGVSGYPEPEQKVILNIECILFTGINRCQVRRSYNDASEIFDRRPRGTSPDTTGYTGYPVYNPVLYSVEWTAGYRIYSEDFIKVQDGKCLYDRKDISAYMTKTKAQPVVIPYICLERRSLPLEARV